MNDERIDPADQLRSDIESAIESQQSVELETEQEAPQGAESNEEIAEESSAPRSRDEKGRFVSKDGARPDAASDVRQDAKVEVPDGAATEVAVRPPPGFSVASKAIWDSVPQSIRDDIAKREQEIDAGFKRYGGLGKFAEEAERNGTTLQRAVSDYVAVESHLGRDFVGGIEYICQRMGVDPRQLTVAMAQRYYQGGQSQDDAATQAPTPMPAAPVDANAIAQHVTNVLRTESQYRDAVSKVESFGADPKNKFFPNVRQAMARMVQSGLAGTIDQAYQAACWNDPEIRDILINEASDGRNKQAAAAVSKSRNAAKAVGGAPAPGVNPDTSNKRKNLSLEEEIRAAVDAQAGVA